MRRTEFKKHIELLNEEDLREELLNLFSKVDSVKKYYLMELGSDTQREKVYQNAKKEIASKYATKSFRKPRRPRIQKVNAIIRRLKKEASLPYEMIDIYLFNAEVAIEFMRKYGYESIPLNNTIVNSYKIAIDSIGIENMNNQYEDRCIKILESTGYIPWLGKELQEIYEGVYY